MAQFPEADLRPAEARDVGRLVEINFSAFPDRRLHDERKRNLVANPLGTLDDVVVAEARGEVVGYAACFALEAWFGGAKVKTGGIASVAVAPEARGRGVGRALMQQMHVLSEMRGDAITMLWPWRQGFYTALGYVTTSSRKRLVFDPRAVPASWSAGSVRRVRGEDREAIVAVYRRAAALTNGWLERPPALWERLFAREERHWLACDDGYVAFTLDQREPHAEVTLVVDELAAATDEARRTLFAALGAMRDQVADVIVEVAEDDPIERVLLDGDRRRFGRVDVEHSLGEIVGGPMVRIEDVGRAIEARGYATDGAFDLVVTDRDEAIHVDVASGRAVVEPARGLAAHALRASRTTLAAILYGGLSATDAARLGLLDADARMLARLDAILALRAVTPIEAF